MLASDRLEAFAAVAAEGSFTRGAKRVGITQSAMSQRIRKLEEELGATLFVRLRERARLTAEGEALLRFVRAREGLEAEMLRGLRPEAERGAGRHAGVLRVAGFSSVTRSILVPALSPLVRESPAVVAHVFARELRDLAGVLRSGEADLVVTDRELPEPGIESLHLGDEQNVLVEPRGPCPSRFLDHDPDDTITDRFATLNGLDLAGVPRSYLDDIYGILDGVAAGWGRAVVSAHLVRGRAGLRVVRGHEPLRTAVFLHGRASRFRSSVERAAIAAIVATFARVLA
ncbi:MAG: LysR family transcriptional regulator [Sandaracinaceae bacterium]|nr:LysR family transcriptional regulator [Sandaracinaceae bacterium]